MYHKFQNYVAKFVNIVVRNRMCGISMVSSQSCNKMTAPTMSRHLNGRKVKLVFKDFVYYAVEIKD